MRITNADLFSILERRLNLNIGDRIKVSGYEYEYVFTIELIPPNDICLKDDSGITEDLKILIDSEIELLPRPKEVGKLKCGEIKHDKCPLNTLCALKNYELVDTGTTLYSALGKAEACVKESGGTFDKDIFYLIKNKLDKESNPGENC